MSFDSSHIIRLHYSFVWIFFQNVYLLSFGSDNSLGDNKFGRLSNSIYKRNELRITRSKESIAYASNKISSKRLLKWVNCQQNFLPANFKNKKSKIFCKKMVLFSIWNISNNLFFINFCSNCLHLFIFQKNGN